MRVQEVRDKRLSPFQIVDGPSEILSALNRHLDRCAIRGLSPRTLRTYAYVSLHVGRWMNDRSINLSSVAERDFWDFLEHLRTHASATFRRASSINLAVTVLRAVCTTVVGRDPLKQRSSSEFQVSDDHDDASRVSAYLRAENTLSRPLQTHEATKFFAGLRSARDLAAASLMLFSGLRIAEVVGLRLTDLDLEAAKIFVRGKGKKDRVVPVGQKTVDLLLSYVAIERPASDHDAVFLVLKGYRRGRPLTVAGLRTNFRHRRKASNVPAANPHRFRHTFAVDMITSGMSLPALQRILGHSQITTTMRYLNLSPEHVREEFDRAVQAMLARNSDG